MGREATFVLELPPSVNESYADVIKRNSTGYYVLRIATKTLKTFKIAASLQLRSQQVPHPEWQEAKAIGYEATFYMKSRGSDLSNRIKVYKAEEL